MAASRGHRGLTQLLLCRVGGKVCGIPLGHVIETMRPLPIEPLADLSRLALGLSLIRGRPTPVLDGRRLFGGEGEQPPKLFVTLRITEQRTAALAVDDVLDVRGISPDSLESLAPILGGQHREAIASLGTVDRELLVVVERAQLLPESFWQRLERASDA